MRNVNCLEGIRCPRCGYERSFEIEIRKFVTVYDDGMDDTGGDTHWDDDSFFQYNQCQFEGRVKDFRLGLEDCEICGTRPPGGVEGDCRDDATRF